MTKEEKVAIREEKVEALKDALLREGWHKSTENVFYTLSNLTTITIYTTEVSVSLGGSIYVSQLFKFNEISIDDDEIYFNSYHGSVRITRYGN